MRHNFKVFRDTRDVFNSFFYIVHRCEKIVFIAADNEVFFITADLKTNITEVAGMHKKGDVFTEHFEIFQKRQAQNNIKNELQAKTGDHFLS